VELEEGEKGEKLGKAIKKCVQLRTCNPFQENRMRPTGSFDGKVGGEPVEKKGGMVGLGRYTVGVWKRERVAVTKLLVGDHKRKNRFAGPMESSPGKSDRR